MFDLFSLKYWMKKDIYFVSHVILSILTYLILIKRDQDRVDAEELIYNH